MHPVKFVISETACAVGKAISVTAVTISKACDQ